MRRLVLGSAFCMFELCQTNYGGGIPSKRPTRLELTKEGLISYQIEVFNCFALLTEEPDSYCPDDSELSGSR